MDEATLLREADWLVAAHLRRADAALADKQVSFSL